MNRLIAPAICAAVVALAVTVAYHAVMRVGMVP